MALTVAPPADAKINRREFKQKLPNGVTKNAVNFSALSTWQGLYGGISASHMMGGLNLDLENALEFDGLGAKGANAGVLFGYNFLLSDRWVTGIEFGAEFGHNAMDFLIYDNLGDYASAKAEIDRELSLSARLGYLITPRTMIFGSVGSSAMHGIGNYAGSVSGYGSMNGSQASDIYGIYSVSLGVETLLNDHWHARFEYSDMIGNTDYKIPYGYTGVMKSDIGKVKASLIWNFSNQQGLLAKTYETFDWKGPYIGGSIVRDRSVSKYDLSTPYASDGYILRDAYFDGISSQGWAGNFLAGYNYCLGDKFILGAEGVVTRSSSETLLSVNANNQTAVADITNPYSFGGRLRAGYLIWRDLLAYAYVGLSEYKTSIGLTKDGARVVTSDITYDRQGLDYGGGVEAFLSKKVSMRLEYGLSNLESVDVVSGASRFGQLEKVNSSAAASILLHF